MIELLKDDDRRITLGHQGRCFVESNFDWRKSLEETVQVCRELVGQANYLRFARLDCCAVLRNFRSFSKLMTKCPLSTQTDT